ncbi:MAG: hypothetical protein L0Y72_21690 [Gemmataceae bacterium]|nr:hypothetical protein [Gemmataceae bacterium]MCI0741654.1 hypothetical protein [Gemmataceae bacterium]
MKRIAVAGVLAAALSGCVTFRPGPETGGGVAPQWGGVAPRWGRQHGPRTVHGVEGPYGQKVAMMPPYNMVPGSPHSAHMMQNSVPLGAVQFQGPGSPVAPGMPPTAIPRGGMISPPGVPLSPGAPSPGLQPISSKMPMGGVVNAHMPPGITMSGGVVPAQFAVNPAMRFQAQRTQIRFVRPSGMKVSWFTQGPDGNPVFSTVPIDAPGRYNFPQAAIYRLKLSNIEGRPGLEVYPTMEVVSCNPKTEAFLAHSSVPVEFTNEDFKQIAEGNYVVKVIYLPDPQFQDVAGTGTDEILSTRLEPGADPIQEALRRGSILVVIRMGNVDQEAPNTPPLNAPGPGGPPPHLLPPGAGPNVQVPFYGTPGQTLNPFGPHGPVTPHTHPPITHPSSMAPGALPPPVPHGLTSTPPKVPLAIPGTQGPPVSLPGAPSDVSLPGASQIPPLPPMGANVQRPDAKATSPVVPPALPLDVKDAPPTPAFPPTPGDVNSNLPPLPPLPPTSSSQRDGAVSAPPAAAPVLPTSAPETK